MTEAASQAKKLPRCNYYPKSSTKMVAKIDMNPKRFKSQYQKIDYFALGDSFVNMFLHAENAFFIKMKGKSLKGLAKCDKQERKLIQEWVDAMPPACQIVFNFGQVDLNFVRYYKLARNETYPDETFDEYVEWISTLNRKCIVLGILASPIKEEDIYEVLLKYNTFQGTEVDQQIVREQNRKTQEVREKWNGLIQSACKKYGIRFINLFEHGKKLEQKFVDQNRLTVHLRYLPTLMELQKILPLISINIQKSLQIEEEYVTEKTSRYQKNLEILQERKKLELLEGQQASTEIATESDGQSVQKQVQGITFDKFLESDDTEQKRMNKKANEPLLKEIPDFSKCWAEDFTHITADVLLKEMDLKKNFTSYCTKTFLYHIGRLADIKQNEDLFYRFFSEMIESGVQSIQIQNPSSEPTQVLEKIQVLTSFASTNEGKQRITKSFVRCLQQLFEKSLNQESSSKQQKITLSKVVRFILSTFLNQKLFVFPLIKDKLITIIIHQIARTLFDYLLMSKICLIKLSYFTQSIQRLKQDLSSFVGKTVSKKLQKLGITEDQLALKFKDVLQYRKPSTKQEIKKIKDDFTLVNQKYSFGVCSQKVLNLMLGQIERKKLQLALDPLVSSAIAKLKSAEIDKTFKNKLFNKIEQIEKKEREPYHPPIGPDDKCCQCGCLLTLSQMLLKKSQRPAQRPTQRPKGIFFKPYK